MPPRDTVAGRRGQREVLGTPKVPDVTVASEGRTVVAAQAERLRYTCIPRRNDVCATVRDTICHMMTVGMCACGSGVLMGDGSDTQLRGQCGAPVTSSHDTCVDRGMETDNSVEMCRLIAATLLRL